MLRELCSVSENEYDDFVGLKFEKGKPKIVFPQGFNLAEDDKQVRHDILHLFSTIQRFSGRHEGVTYNSFDGESSLVFPILSYQYVIHDFLAHGYYIEQEIQYNSDRKGKIHWGKTIKKKQPIINNGNLIYLDYIVKTNKINNNNIISLIHHFCVRESFERLGWLYLSSNILPQKATIKFNKKLFLNVLNDALNNTYNENKQRLFTSMINIVKSKAENVNDLDKEAFGVYRFEYIWENMIDYVFGEDNKEKYFPHARWHIINGGKTESSALEPDTIMIYGGKLFVLDAKYYRYGITGQINHLPATSSIQKQITYGEYIKTKQFVKKDDIYNAFIMPFKANDNDEIIKFVSVGTADWIDYVPQTENYKYVLGILIDTKYLMDNYTRYNISEIEKMSNLIIESLATYRNK